MSTPHILSGADFALNSYMGHEFEVRELPSSKSGVCTQRSEDQTCGNGLFAVSENNDQRKYSTRMVGLNIEGYVSSYSNGTTIFS